MLSVDEFHARETAFGPVAVAASPGGTVGDWVSLTPVWYSYAPRSSYRRWPAPVFGVDGSSTRGLLSASTADSPDAAELAESIASEPTWRWRFGVVLLIHFGSA